MAAEIITTGDLQIFKTELLEEFKKIIAESTGHPTRKWLKSIEVRRLLNISPGTLQNLRINGTLPYTKIGGALYYDYDIIQKIIKDNQICNR
jgi:hypothetical protein